MGDFWHVTEEAGGLTPGLYCEDRATFDLLVADPNIETATVPAGSPSPLLHGMRVYEDFATKEARSEALRPAIGKPLSRRARRRNRGRVRAAKGVLMRRFSPSVQWAWPDQPTRPPTAGLTRNQKGPGSDAGALWDTIRRRGG